MNSTRKTELIRASRERFDRSQAAAVDLGDFVQALLLHVNEVARVLQGERPDGGHVFRIGISYLSTDGLVLPVRFRRSSPSLFVDQFHAMPLDKTSLGELFLGGHGDTIPDMAEHLARRGQSLSSQVALREGVRSNARIPWFSLDRKGVLYFSANVPRFFGTELLEELHAITQRVELHLRLSDAFDLARQFKDSGQASIESSLTGMNQLARLLDVHDNPAPGRLVLDHLPALGAAARLINLWPRQGDKVFLMAIEMQDQQLDSINHLLLLRGLVLQQAAGHANPSTIMDRLLAAYAGGQSEGWIAEMKDAIKGLALGLIHLDHGHMDFVQTGTAQLFAADGKPLPVFSNGVLPAKDCSSSVVSVSREAGIAVIQGAEGSESQRRLNIHLA